MSRDAQAGAPSRLARVLVGCYPPAWRDRYGQEYLTLLTESGIGLRTAGNAVAGAADAWVRPASHLLPVPQRLRATLSMVLCAWTALAAGALVFGQVTEDQPFRDLDAATPVAHWLYTTYVIAAPLSVAAVVLGGLPLAYSLYRGAGHAQRRDVLTLLATPGLALVVFAVALVAVAKLVHHSSTPGVGVGPGWFLVLVAAGVVAGAACAAGPATAVRRLPADPRAVRIAVLGAVPAILGMFVVSATSVGYAIELRSAAPGLAEPWSLLAPYAAVMLAACAIGGVSSARGLRALRSVAGPG